MKSCLVGKGGLTELGDPGFGWKAMMCGLEKIVQSLFFLRMVVDFRVSMLVVFQERGLIRAEFFEMGRMKLLSSRLMVVQPWA